MNTILEWVRKNNHRDWTKMIVSVFVYAGFCLLYSSENNTTAFLMVGGLLAVVICLDAGRYFVDSYLKVYTGGYCREKYSF